MSLTVRLRFWLLATAMTLPRFPDGSPWYLDVSQSTDVHSDSASITQWLQDAGCWGAAANDYDFKIDKTSVMVEVGCDSRTVPFLRNTAKKPTYYGACDMEVSGIPVPGDGSGTLQVPWTFQQTWTTSADCYGDCHMLIHDTTNGLLYESWDTAVSVVNGEVMNITATCLVVWNTSHLYDETGLGEGCTSADAAGFPISSLLFTADEIAAGEIAHAIRFILPNDRMRANYYIHPATHWGGPAADSEYAPVYGARFRLKADYNISGFSAGAQIVLKALKKYGMFLSDGGNLPLAALGDAYSGYSGSTFAANDLTVWDLYGVKCSDFDVMNGWGADPLKGPNRPPCVKNDIPLHFEQLCDEPVDETTTPQPQSSAATTSAATTNAATTKSATTKTATTNAATTKTVTTEGETTESPISTDDGRSSQTNPGLSLLLSLTVASICFL